MESLTETLLVNKLCEMKFQFTSPVIARLITMLWGSRLSISVHCKPRSLVDSLVATKTIKSYRNCVGLEVRVNIQFTINN